MGKTLYLNENNNDLWVKRDGPSVLIKAKERAVQRIPVRLVSRVTIIGNVKLDAGAITLFTENNIPVLLMNNSAEEAAVAIPYNHRLPKHYREQKVFLENEENIKKYEKWANTKRMVIQIKILKRLYSPLARKIGKGIGEGNYQKLISQIKPSDDEKWLVVKNIITNLFRNLVIEHLTKADLNPHLGVLCRRHNFGFALDICYIMGAECDMQSLQFFKCAETKPYFDIKDDKWTVTEAGIKNIILRFENRIESLSNMIELIIDELFELMRELRT